ncbi:MAG: hypothetical protein Q8R36_03515 [bacterium]|nr:hypothetical protein [bacterium]
MNYIRLNAGGKVYCLTNQNNGNKYDRAKEDAGLNATSEQILAHYDKLGGYIQDENGQKINNGKCWEVEKARLADEIDNLKNKSDEHLEEIIRRAENTNIPGSLFQRAKIELEIRDRRRGNVQDIKWVSVFRKYRDEIIIGVVVTVVGGLILAWIL